MISNAIRDPLGTDFGAILERFWGGFGEPKRGMIIPLDLGFCNGFGILFGKFWGRFCMVKRGRDRAAGAVEGHPTCSAAFAKLTRSLGIFWRVLLFVRFLSALPVHC